MRMTQKNKKYSVGIVPGSFDPITVGHIDIIRRASEICETVYVAVMINAEKQYMFSLDERRDIAEVVCEAFLNVKVISSDGMLYALAKDLSAEVIIKGVRNEVDREYELKMARFNEEKYPAAKTLLLDADEALSSVSSTLVREKIGEKGSLCGYLSPRAIQKINKILENKKKKF